MRFSALAWATNSLGGYRESEIYWRESLALCKKIGDRGGEADALNQLGWVALAMGGPRLSDATAYYQEALSLFRECGDLNRLANCLGDMALMYADLGKYEQAIQFAGEGFAIAEEIGHFDLAPYNLLCMATALCGLRDFQASRHHLLEAIKRSWELQVLPFVVTALYYLADLLAAESTLPDLAAELSAQKKGSALELLSLVLEHPGWWQPFKDRASDLQGRLESELPANVVIAAKARGRKLALEEVVEKILNAEKFTGSDVPAPP